MADMPELQPVGCMHFQNAEEVQGSGIPALYFGVPAAPNMDGIERPNCASHKRLCAGIIAINIKGPIAPNSYQARDLMNGTLLGLFNGDELQESQVRAKAIILGTLGDFGDPDTVGGRFLLMYDFFDEYFFFGKLSHYSTFSCVEDPSMNGPKLGINGCCATRTCYHQEIMIYKNPHPERLHPMRRYDLVAKELEMVGTLLHVMSLAYLRLFRCHRRQCTENMVNTCGVEGHGPVWQTLADGIQQHIRTWHPLFANIQLSQDDIYGNDTMAVAHNKEIAIWTECGWLNGYKKYMAPTKPQMLFNLRNGKCVYREDLEAFDAAGG